MKPSFFCGEAALGELAQHLGASYPYSKIGIMGAAPDCFMEAVLKNCPCEQDEAHIGADAVRAVVAFGKREFLKRAYRMAFNFKKPLYLVFSDLCDFLDFRLPLFSGPLVCPVLHFPRLREASDKRGTDMEGYNAVEPFSLIMSRAGILENLAFETLFEGVNHEATIYSLEGFLNEFAAFGYSAARLSILNFNRFCEIALKFVHFFEGAKLEKYNLAAAAASLYCEREGGKAVPHANASACAVVQLVCALLIFRICKKFLSREAVDLSTQADFIKRIRFNSRRQNLAPSIIESLKSYYSLDEDFCKLNRHKKELLLINTRVGALIERAFSAVRPVFLGAPDNPLADIDKTYLKKAVNFSIDCCKYNLLTIMRNLGLFDLAG